eukprot:3176-Heterococcus_DN1.PRE.1
MAEYTVYGHYWMDAGYHYYTSTHTKENNVDYIRNLYYAAQCVRLVVLMPLFIAWAWGLSTDFAGLSSVFFTISMLPLVLMLFTKQQTTAQSTADTTSKGTSNRDATAAGTVMDIIAAVKLQYEQSLLYDQEEAGVSDTNSNAKDSTIGIDDAPRNAIQQLLGTQYYSLHASISTFKWAVASLIDSTATTAAAASATTKGFVKLYCYSLASMLVYFIIALARTEHGALAFLNAFTLCVVIDSILYSNTNANATGSTGAKHHWSPATSALLLDYKWLIGQQQHYLTDGATATLIYHNCTACNIYTFDNSYLPPVYDGSSSNTSNSQQTRSQHRSTNKSKRRRNDSRAMNGNDIASQPAANLVYIRDNARCQRFNTDDICLPLPHQTVPMATQQWSMIAFGIISYIIVASTCLMVATNRALSLSSGVALSRKLQRLYMYHHSVKLPAILACMSVMNGCSLVCWPPENTIDAKRHIYGEGENVSALYTTVNSNSDSTRQQQQPTTYQDSSYDGAYNDGVDDAAYDYTATAPEATADQYNGDITAAAMHNNITSSDYEYNRHDYKISTNN